MSLPQQPGSGRAYAEKLFPAKYMDVEQTILNLIDRIGAAAVMGDSVGDMTKANAVMEYTVLQLDTFVNALFMSDRDRDWSEYKKRRDDIIGRWPKPPAPGQPAPHVSPDLVRELEWLTIYTVASQRLFRMKRQVYFGVAWKLKEQAKLGALLSEEEKEGDAEDPDEG